MASFVGCAGVSFRSVAVRPPRREAYIAHVNSADVEDVFIKAGDGVVVDGSRRAREKREAQGEIRRRPRPRGDGGGDGGGGRRWRRRRRGWQGDDVERRGRGRGRWRRCGR